jgi:Tfp pilus assembly protein PilO
MAILKMPAGIKDSIDKAANFINERTAQEKKMILILGVCVILALDYWIVLKPVIGAFTKNTPLINTLKKEVKTFKEDKKNERIIKKDWQAVKEKLDGMEKSFISTDEIPVLLENLSRLASDSQVRIISLKPMETQKSDRTGPYKRTPIKIEASATTHAFGNFLSKLETGMVFYRVTNLKITGNDAGGAAHMMDLELEAYQKGL